MPIYNYKKHFLKIISFESLNLNLRKVKVLNLKNYKKIKAI